MMNPVAPLTTERRMLAHPHIAEACRVPVPTTRRNLAGAASRDPDRMVVLGCLTSLILLPFLL